MKLICELNDENLLGKPGRSEKPPRITVRAIVRNGQGLYALVYSGDWGIYSLPGGGVDPGEDLLTALRREVREETGCDCGAVRELGTVRENRACQDYTQENHYYLVDAAGPAHELLLTEQEQENRVSIGWHSYEDAVRLIAQPHFERVSKIYFQARDLAALREYEAWNQSP